MSTQTYKKSHPPKPLLENDKGKPHQGIYIPKHPEKVIGGDIIYRSGWELAFAQWCDLNTSVVEWGAEPMCVQYRNPAGVDFDSCKKYGVNPQDPINWPVANYYPDFYVNLKSTAENEPNLKLIVEIKPKYQTERPIAPPAGAKLKEQKAYVNAVKTYLQNIKKWEAAMEWCKEHGFEFKVYTEVTLAKTGIISHGG